MWRSLYLALLIDVVSGCSGTTKGDVSPAETSDTASPTETSDPCRRGCASTPTSSETGATLRVTFSIAPNLVDQLDGPPEGPFIGEVYRADDVGPLGPDDGAVALGDIEIDLLVLPEDGLSTEVLFELQPVPPLSITILGFVDTDGNMDEANPEPDQGDPVTLPNDNTFDLLPDVVNTVDVHFGLLNPF